MSDPSERHSTFDVIADKVSRTNTCSKDLVFNRLNSDLWNRKFASQNLRWYERRASKRLFPGEPHFDTPPPRIYNAEKGDDDQAIPLEPHQSIARLDELETESLVRRANAISGGEKFTGQSDRVALILFLLDHRFNEQAPAAGAKSVPVKPAGPKDAAGFTEGGQWTEKDVSKFLKDTTDGRDLKQHSACPDYPEETSLDELFGYLSDFGEPLVSDAFDEAGRPNFRRLAIVEFCDFTAKSKTVLKNVAIPDDEVCRFCDRNDYKRPKSVEQALAPETQPQNQSQSEAVATSNALHTRPQSETAKLRKQVREWIEEFAATKEATGCVKADFLQRAREEVDTRITENMFKEMWRAAEIPAVFRNAGVRLKHTPE